jgi:DNA polymerase (family 10)
VAKGQARPDNAGVADILSDIADLLEIKGEQLFKILAYRRAATEVRTLARDVYDYVREDKLTELPGIGKSIAVKIVEIESTGTCEFYEELKLAFPPGLIKLMEIQGVGPKKAKLLYDEVGVDSLDKLEEAVDLHKLRDLKGFGEKTEENITRGIKLWRSHHDRILLSEAYPLAHRIVEELKRDPAVIHAEPGGSLRRMQETIGDIDILASSERPDEVMEAFTTLPEVDAVLGKGRTKSSVIVGVGLQMDLRVVRPEEWGAALQYFTGSKAHNVRLRELAKDKGLKLNEYGVFRTDDDSRVAGATEEEVYAALGMGCMPPTMRLDRGEIELAMTGELPRPIEATDIRGDLHVHTHLSDGMDTLERIHEKAAQLGYEYVAITDHAETLKVARGLTVDRLEESFAAIAAFNEAHPGFTFLTGTELNISNDGELDYPDELLAKMDVVVASIHTGMNQDIDQITRRTLAAIERPHVDIIAHPTGRILGKRAPFAIDIDAVLDAAARTGTAMELNSYPDRLDLRDEHLRLAREKGVKVAVNTDAHAADQLEYMFFGVATAQRGWLGPDDVVNAWPLAKLRGWLER